jgi:hypothetical protein
MRLAHGDTINLLLIDDFLGFCLDLRHASYLCKTDALALDVFGDGEETKK